jgi:hypothetical protein
MFVDLGALKGMIGNISLKGQHKWQVNNLNIL